MIQQAKQRGKAIMDDLKLQHWHLSKRVQIADIVGMVVIAVTLAYWIFGIEKEVDLNGSRIDRHEAIMAVEIKNLKEQDAQIRLEIDEHFEAILIQLRRIEDKLDRHTEGHNGPGMQLQTQVNEFVRNQNGR